MEWFRRERNPWGQEILIGLSWDLIWVAVVAGALLIVAHALLYYWRWRESGAGAGTISETLLKEIPERILRHSGASRLFHWVMAVSVLALLFTAFLPIWGIKFPWVTAHWIAGVVLTAAIIFHIIHASLWKGLSLMWISSQDLSDGGLAIGQDLGADAPPPGKPGKNPLENKLFHHVVAIATLATIITGLIMMAKVDTPWWSRNPYILSDDTWGIIYVVHGAGSVALITLIMAHLYFAARPEKRWITLSMLYGWISRERYLEHYSQGRWPVGGNTSAATAASAAKQSEAGSQRAGAS
ncbi:MAG: cytochrome b/b6 domain-containing protein [Deltaproteobacteria bacterium]|nr:cytochrome b/b6 domain-containing protein [Deltaproteobacteria bacterium]